MSLPLMMDVQVPMQITKRLRDAGVDVKAVELIELVDRVAVGRLGGAVGLR